MSVGISLFDEPPRITFSKPELTDGHREGLLLGLVLHGDKPRLDGIAVLGDGRITLCDPGLFTLDWRYNPETDKWSDLDAPKPVQTDQEG